MSNEQPNDHVTPGVPDEITLHGSVPRQQPAGHDQHAQYTHALTDDTAESGTRALVRFVPLAYGALLGELAGALTLGLSAGLAASVAFDLYMGKHSMVRALSSGLRRRGCPLVAAVARLSVSAMGRLGLAAPAALTGVRCDLSDL